MAERRQLLANDVPLSSPTSLFYISNNRVRGANVPVIPIVPSDGCSTGCRKLFQLSMEQFHELLTDIYDEYTRRQQNKVSFLSIRDDFHPNRNIARQKLATISTFRFEELWSDVHNVWTLRFHEFAEEHPVHGLDSDVHPSPEFPSKPGIPSTKATNSAARRMGNATYISLRKSNTGGADAVWGFTSRWMPSAGATSNKYRQSATRTSHVQDFNNLPAHSKSRRVSGFISLGSSGEEAWPPTRISLKFFCDLNVFQALAHKVLDANSSICRSSCLGQSSHRCCHSWLSEQFSTWMTWNDLETLWSWRAIYTELYAKYRELKPGYGEVASTSSDISRLSDLMCGILKSPSKQQLMQSRERNAIALVDLLQILIDYEHWTDHDRPPRAKLFERVLKQLAGDSGVLPCYLFLTGVERQGQYPISGGGFADIYQGKVQGHLVALKVLRFFSTEEEDLTVQKEICKEALIWRQFFHPCILPFYGICNELFGGRLCLVSPWMNNGSIMNYLSKDSNVERYPVMIKVVSGLCYLHGLEPPVVHGDLRGANILVTDDGCPQIADFGISEVIDSYATGGTVTCTTRGATRWMAPELLDYTRSKEGFIPASTASDVYSFACLCIEVFSGKVPFHKLREAAVVSAILHDQRPELSSEAVAQGLSNPVWKVMQECWRAEPSERPTMAAVFKRLEGKPYEENESVAWAWSTRPHEMTETLASICRGVDVNQSPFRCNNL